jgi:hypothetical protein
LFDLLMLALLVAGFAAAVAYVGACCALTHAP